VLQYFDGNETYLAFSGEISGVSTWLGIIDGVGYSKFAVDSNDLPSLHVLGAAGADYLAGYGEKDELEGGAGNDVLLGDLGKMWTDQGWIDLPGGGSADLLRGDEGQDVLLGIGGDDLLLGGADDDFLSGEAGKDGLDGDGGNDVLAGGDGDDQLSGGAGADVLLGDKWLGYGNNTPLDWYAIQPATWSTGASFDSQGRMASLNPQGFYLGINMVGNDFLAGGAGNDWLEGDGGDDLLLGDADNDTLLGGEGQDILDGGTGNDWLQGDEGIDILAGGDGDDLLFGGADNDILDGGAGIDELQGGEGNDMLSGGEGADLLAGQGGEDIVHGNEGDDQLQGKEGNDTLAGGAGNDTLFGGADSDLLDGGSGNDYLDGGDGDDVYVFGWGSGQDAIFDVGSVTGDVVRLSDNITPEDVDIRRYQDALLIALGSGSDTLVVSNWFTTGANRIERLEFADGTVWNAATILSMLPESETQPGDGSASNTQPWELNASGTGVIVAGMSIVLPLAYQGTWVNGMPLSVAQSINMFTGYWLAQKAAGDTSATTPENKTINGSAYDDYLYGGAGDDKLYGYDGNDYLTGADGHDVIRGGFGQDLLFGNDGSDSLYGDEGNDVLDGGAGDDYLSDTAGNNVMYGGAGRDYFEGGTGDDTMNGGDGDDYLEDRYGGKNTLLGGAGNDDLRGWIGIERLDGGDGNDYLQGWDGDDTLIGGAGNDYLVGGSGDDVYLFGRGDGCDKVEARDLYSGIYIDPAERTNADILRFATGLAPSDIVASRSRSYIEGSWDGGYSYSAISRDLILTIQDTGDSVTLESWFNDMEISNMRIEFSDGTVLDNTLLALTPLMGTEGDDCRIIELDDMGLNYVADLSLRGGDLNEMLDGRAGNDELNGGAGNDILYGGTGDDSLLVLSCVINGNYVKVGACQEKRLKLPVANKNGRFSSG